MILYFQISYPFNPFSTLAPEWSLFLGGKVIISHPYLKSFDGGSNCLAQLLSKAGALCIPAAGPLSALAPSQNPLLRCVLDHGAALLRTAHDPRCWHPLFLLPGLPFSLVFLFFPGPAPMPLLVSHHKCDDCPVSIHLFLNASMSLPPFVCMAVNCVGVCLVTKLEIVAGRDLVLHLFIPRICVQRERSWGKGIERQGGDARWIVCLRKGSVNLSSSQVQS